MSNLIITKDSGEVVAQGWSPAGLEPSLQTVLAVPVSATQVMNRSLYMDLLTAKLDAMIEADPQAARRAMEMSEEHSPELYSITMYCNPEHWAGAIVQSDRMRVILADADWTGVVGPYE